MMQTECIYPGSDRITDIRFILVKLRLKLLLGSPKKIMADLGSLNLPTTVHDAYRRLLDRTNDKEDVFKILSWIYHAKRPLTMDELR